MYGGSMVALATPMREDGSLDYDALGRLIDFHIDNGTDAIVATGTTGEAPTLVRDEHVAFLKETVALAGGRIPVIAGTGSNSTQQTLDLTQRAFETGADACLLVAPAYNKPTQEGLYRHFSTVAEAVDGPVILYNVPGRTACDVKPETVARLMGIDNIVGLKEATPDLTRLHELREVCGDGIELYSGEDATAMEFMLGGGHGVVSVTANIAPRQMHDLSAAAVASDRERAQTLNERLAPLHIALFLQSNPIPVKWALYEMGLAGPGIRLPLTPLSEEHRDQLREALQTAGCI